MNVLVPACFYSIALKLPVSVASCRTFLHFKSKNRAEDKKQRSSLLGAIKITSWLRLWSAATAAKKHHNSSFFFLHFPLKTPPQPWQTVSSDNSGASVSSGWVATSQLLAQPLLAAPRVSAQLRVVGSSKKENKVGGEIKRGVWWGRRLKGWGWVDGGGGAEGRKGRIKASGGAVLLW